MGEERKIETKTGAIVEPRFYAYAEWHVINRLPMDMSRVKIARSVCRVLPEYLDMTPEEFEWPATEDAIADILGRGRTTLWRWRSTNEFWILRDQLADDWVRDSRAGRRAVAVVSAQIPGKEGFSDRKHLDELEGSVVKRHEVKTESNVNVDVTVRGVRGKTEEEMRRDMFFELRREFPEKSKEEIAGMQRAMIRMARKTGMPAPEEEGVEVPVARNDEIVIPYEDWHEEEEAAA